MIRQSPRQKRIGRVIERAMNRRRKLTSARFLRRYFLEAMFPDAAGRAARVSPTLIYNQSTLERLRQATEANEKFGMNWPFERI